ncbi:MAG: type II CAAX endopeptidase family protein [Chloroflexota bacterium]|nr:type II CAAX endopeptidase family protein [Chloroflexota bacterium]
MNEEINPYPAPCPSGTCPRVPWTSRDVWVSAGILFFLLFLVAGSAFLLPALDAGLLLIGGELLFLLPVWWLGLRKHNASWNDLGLRNFAASSLGLGCGLMILSWGFNLVYSLMLAIYGLQVQPDIKLLFADISSPGWIFIAGVVIAPVVEEIIFRGFIFAGLRGRYGWKKAALISSALFALIHIQPLAVIPIFILGLIFAYLYQRSGSIWPAIIMHMSTNALALGAAYIVSEYFQV